MEKSDVEKQPPLDSSLSIPPPDSSSSSSSSASNNPLYCSYVDGKFTYKDPSTSTQYVWNEMEKKWVVREPEEASSPGEGQIDSNKLSELKEGDGSSSDNKNLGTGGVSGMISPAGTSQVQFDGESYTYTDQDGTVFLWDAGKGAWFPKDPPSPTSLLSSVSGLRNATDPSSSLLPPSPPDLSQPTTQSVGFFNPNYATCLTSPTTATVDVDEQGNTEQSETVTNTSSRRFYYASLSPTSMGVNENPGLFLSPDDQVNNNDQVVGGNGGSDNALQQQDHGEDNNEQDSNIVADDNGSGTENREESSDKLPPGWEKHEDNNGPYYWHVKSGTIQRERPTMNSPVSSVISQVMGSGSGSNNPALMIPGGMMSGIVRRSNTVVGGFGGNSNTTTGNNNSGGSGGNEKRKSWVNYLDDNKDKRASLDIGQMSSLHNQQQGSVIPAYEFDKHTLKFAAVSLGCLSICEEDLTPERSSRAVSKVIAELTSGKDGRRLNSGLVYRHELPTRIWTHTDTITLQNQMYLELTDSHLRVKVHKMAETSLTSSPTITVLEQPIHSIRVWGVGREDPRDFAFVAREKQTRQFLCHVFRLEMYARPLASSLRDACKKIMIERQARVGNGGGSNNGGKRPTSLGLRKSNNSSGTSGQSGKSGSGGNVGSSATSGLLFPTPMDEPRKVIKAYYLGSKCVKRPTGMEVLNGAINGLKASGVEKIPVLVSVAPSVIGVTSTSENPPKVQIEVRVRFLSFMGIGADIRTCGIIIHTARDDFEAHCFYSTPSTGALCKAIEAACVLRYQKCLDAHHPEGSANCGVNCKSSSRSDSISDGSNNPQTTGSTSSSTATSPKSAAMIAAAASASSNLASAFKTLSEDFMVTYQLAYGSNVREDSSEEEEDDIKVKAATTNQLKKNQDKQKNQPQEQQQPKWFDLEDSQNTHVYVSNLPLDIDENEFVEFMGKCGLVMKDASGNWKAKLYRDGGTGWLKGDGVCTYIKVDSVNLALQILDGSYFKSNIVRVERAKFQQKGDYDASRKPKQKKKKDKLKFKKQQESLFSWKPEKLRGEKGKNERVVVVKNAFHPDEFNEAVELILELKEDFKMEADKLGACKKVDLFDNNTEGAIKITMTTPEEATAVVNNFNGRFFGGKKLEAYIWDGFEKLNVVETEAERNKRLERWEKYVDDEDGGSSSNKKPKMQEDDEDATPPHRGEGQHEIDSDDDKKFDEDD